MGRSEYFAECSRLSDSFAEKVKAVKDYMKTEPNFANDEAYRTLCDLQDEATAASGAWLSCCQTYRLLFDQFSAPSL